MTAPEPTGRRYDYEPRLIFEAVTVLGFRVGWQQVWTRVLVEIPVGDPRYENAPIAEGIILDPRFFTLN